MPNRRGFLQALSSLPLISNLATRGNAAAAVATAAKRDYFKELGVTPIINGAGVYTMFTASLMWPEAVAAIEATSHRFCRLDELHDAVGKRIAALIGCEAAMVPSGAAAALTCGTAACVAGSNPDFIKRLPDTTGMKNEVIIQKSHRYGYDHAVRSCGIRFVEVETREELESAVNERTAMMHFFNAAGPKGQIKVAEFAQLGKKHRIPTFNDAAADVPPVENLSKYIKMGYDLVTFSGGKGIRGPQSAGLLLGRKDLIQAARLNTSPNSDSIGRGLKVNKEEFVGMLAALEMYIKHDHQAEWREWENRLKLIGDTLAPLKGVTTEVFTPEIANNVPHLRVRWDPSTIKITWGEAMRQLREGIPAIELVPSSYVEGTLEVAAWTLEPGEARIVAQRISEVLTNKA